MMVWHMDSETFVAFAPWMQWAPAYHLTTKQRETLR